MLLSGHFWIGCLVVATSLFEIILLDLFSSSREFWWNGRILCGADRKKRWVGRVGRILGRVLYLRLLFLFRLRCGKWVLGEILGREALNNNGRVLCKGDLRRLKITKGNINKITMTNGTQSILCTKGNTNESFYNIKYNGKPPTTETTKGSSYVREYKGNHPTK